MAQKHFFRRFMTGRVITHSNGFYKGRNKKSQKTKQNPTPPHSPWQTFSNSFLSVFIETYPPTLLTTWNHTPSCHLPRKKKKASRYNKHEFTWTNSHTAMNKVDKSRTLFQVHPCGKVFTHDQQTWKTHSRSFWTLSVLRLGEQHRHRAGVRQRFQAATQNQIQTKTHLPSCCHGSSKYGNRALLCRGPRLRERTAIHQSMWLCGRIKHASVLLAHALFTFFKNIKGHTAE